MLTVNVDINTNWSGWSCYFKICWDILHSKLNAFVKTLTLNLSLFYHSKMYFKGNHVALHFFKISAQ